MINTRPRTAPTRAIEMMESADASQGQRGFQSPQHATLHPDNEPPSFTFVCLGVGGGPLEGDCSCYMLKPAHRAWSEGAVVVEGGSWLGALTRVLEDNSPNSAFAEVPFPHDSPALRAGYLGSFAHSFLISHAHLDHILGMVLGSASLPGRRQVYGLRPTLENLMGVFNGKIWPKLASFDDDGGPAVYLLKSLQNQVDATVDEALTVLPFALSHGLNPSVPPAPPTPTQVFNAPSTHFSKRYSLPLNGYFPNLLAVSPLDRSSSSAGERPTFTSPFAPERSLLNKVERSRIDEGQVSDGPMVSYKPPPLSAKSPARANGPPSRSSRRPRTAQGSEHVSEESDAASSQGTPTPAASSKTQAGSGTKAPPRRVSIDHSPPALDSTAFFITNNQTGKDVLFFGDVEPDCVSRSPRNKKVWTHAARRYVEGKLNTIFLECSFPAAHPTEFLYGHLSVNHLYEELRTLSRLVIAERKRQKLRRQKAGEPSRAGGAVPSPLESPAYSRLTPAQLPPIPASPTAASSVNDEDLRRSLQGLSIVVVHVKMALFPSYGAASSTVDTPPSPSSFTTAENGDDGAGTEAREGSQRKVLSYAERLIDPRAMQERILEELSEMECEFGLGVHFIMAKQGMRIEC